MRNLSLIKIWYGGMIPVSGVPWGHCVIASGSHEFIIVFLLLIWSLFWLQSAPIQKQEQVMHIMEIKETGIKQSELQKQIMLKLSIEVS